MTSQLIIYAIVLLASGAMSTLRWYQKKKIVMDAERAERDREQAILRTGRDPRSEAADLSNRSAPSRGEAPRPTQRPREADLMAERQEALRQLRRQQADRAETANPQPIQRDLPPINNTGGGGSGAGGPITRELWPGGPVVVIGGPPPVPAQSPNANRPMPPSQQELRRPPQPVPQQRRQQPQRIEKAKPVQKRPQQQSQRPQQQQPQRQPQASAFTQTRRAEARQSEATIQRERAIARTKASTILEPAAAVPVFVKPTTAQQWRTAFIAAEIMGTPVSMRDSSATIGCPTH